MEELLACRVCLITDVKLFDMFKYKLAEPYQIITGTQISADGLPIHICSICAALLRKSVTFKTKCHNAQHILKFSLMQQHMLTTAYLRTIDRNLHSLTLPLTKTTIDNTMELTYEIKEETYNTDIETIDNDNVSVKYESDEEPLAKKVRKKRKKKEIKIEDDIKFESNLGNSENDFGNIENDLGNAENDLGNSENDFGNIENDLGNAENDLGNTENDLGNAVNNLGNAENDLGILENELRNVGNQNLRDNVNENKVIDEINYLEGLNDIQVIVLSKEQQIEEVLLRKNSFNYLNSFYKCDKCYKGFITDSTYKNHMARHAPVSGAHVCDVCGTRWAHARALRAHVVASHERKYLCRKCDHVSKSSHRAKEHSKWHLGFTYTCKICGATFSKSTSHLTHIRLQHPSNHCCELCGEAFIGEYGLAMHRKKAHRHQSGAKPDSLCALCGVRFRSVDALNRHISALEDNTCNTSLRPCLSCGAGFSSEEELKEHLKIHATDDYVKCEECNRTFAHEKSYAVHYQRVHLRVRAEGGAGEGAGGRRARGDRVVCEICGKKCTSNATLVYHQRTHTGEKPYQCSKCPKRFSVCQLLQIHVRTHTGERPFSCARCPKAFKHKAALNRHDRVHTGAKPYSCPHCGKSFSQSNSMKTHVNTVHLKLPAPYRHRRNKTE